MKPSNWFRYCKDSDENKYSQVRQGEDVDCVTTDTEQILLAVLFMACFESIRLASRSITAIISILTV